MVKPVIQVARYSVPPTAKDWHYAAELRTLSVTYPLCGSALTDTDTDNLPNMFSNNLIDRHILISREDNYFVPLTIHNLKVSQLGRTQDQTSNPQMRVQAL